MSNRLNRRLRDLLKRMEPKVAKAFNDAIANITNNAKLGRIVAALERGDINAAIIAMDFDKAAFDAVNGAVRSAYAEAGALVVTNTVWRGIDGQRVVVYWNASNPRAERWLADVSSQFVTRLSNEAREIMRDVIQSGYAKGYGPRQIGLDLVGRIGANGRRNGGLIGLSNPQSKAVEHMRDILTTGQGYDKLFNMTKRDRRYDAMIRRAMESGTPLTQAQIDKITGRYSDRLLKLRGDTIARTETAQAVEAARQEAFAQWQDKTGVEDKYIIRRWDHAGGGKSSRDWHMEMDGWTVRGMTEPFVTPRGARMMYPLDGSLGAGAVELVNCRCMQTILVDYKAMAV